MLLLIISAVVLSSIGAYAQNCVPVDFGADSIVCMCNSTYCDFYPDPNPPEEGEFICYISSQSGDRLRRTGGKITKELKDEYTVRINSKKEYQTMEGFGGAFTDSACMNIKNISEAAQNNLLRSYFSTDGSNYNFGRVPIAGTDFSTRTYSYDDTPGDVTLQDFKLADEDTKYKLPVMQKALEMNPSLRFVSAAWTAPPWMKTRDTFNGFGYLQDQYYQVYADYIVKFLEEYKNRGFEIWAVSTGNEPLTNLIPYHGINSMFWTPGTVSKWVVENLGPSIQNSTSHNTLLLILDDQRLNLPWYMLDIKYRHAEALNYISGIAVHWYTDDFTPPYVLDVTHNQVPDKFILLTEACVGDRPWQKPKVLLGSWERAESIIDKMFQNFDHWVVGWIDWNLALNPDGGPNWIDNRVDAPIIVDAEKDLFYKQPMYYAMTHFSKFVPRSSIKIDTRSSDSRVVPAAFKTKDNRIVVVVWNKGNKDLNVSLVDDSVGNMHMILGAHSIHTIVYNNK